MAKRQYQPSTDEWFHAFVQGNQVSCVDAVLSPIERRLLPPVNFPTYATPNQQLHGQVSATLGYETREKSLWPGRLRRNVSGWVHTEPVAFGEARFLRLGAGLKWFHEFFVASSSSVREKQEQQLQQQQLQQQLLEERQKQNPSPKETQNQNNNNNDNNNNLNKSIYPRVSVNTAVFGELSDRQLRDWSTGASFYFSRSPNKKLQLSFQRGAHLTGLAFLLAEFPSISWYFSLSTQQDPSFTMVRANVVVPVTETSEISLYADPLRRVHLALCTKVTDSFDAGMRLRLNTISWRDAGLDAGAMVSAGVLMNRPLRIGVQTTNFSNLHFFADFSILQANLPESAASRQIRWQDWQQSLLLGLRVGIILTRFKTSPSSSSSNSSSLAPGLGADFYLKCEF